jgi:hypothetical protein
LIDRNREGMLMVEDKFTLNRIKIILTVIFLSAYLLGASVQAFYVNTDMDKADQLDYMVRAISLKTDFYKNITDGNRMPVYPYLLSFLYHPGMTMDDFFWRGKVFNIILSVLLLFLLYILFRSYLDGQAAKVLLLIVGLMVFMPRAGYIQSELPFYFLTFCAFLLFWGCLTKPRLWTAASAGLVAGLGYLTKASLLPALVWFVGCYLVINVAMPVMKGIVQKFHEKMVAPPHHIGRNMAFLGVFILIFFLTVSPYIRMNKKVFGHYFYNVNSTLYVWYDSWDQVVQGTRAHGDRVGWPQMPSEEIPSGTKYWHEHTLSKIVDRLTNGFIIVSTNAMGGFGYTQYFFIYLIICMAAIIQRYGEFDEYLKKDNHTAVAISLVLYFLLYFMLYTFGAVIFKGPRHILAQYLPALFIMFYFLSRFGFSYYAEKINCHFKVREVHIVVFCLLVLDLIFNVPYRIYMIFWGW